MKKSTTVVYTNNEVEVLLSKEVASIQQEVKTYAIDLAQKSLPKLGDKLEAYISKVRSPFQNLLEKIHKKMSALGVTTEIESVKENYQKEQQTLEDELDDTGQELRLLKKQQKDLKSTTVGNEIRNWKIAFIGIIILTFTEIIINYKIFLPISSNTGTALALAGGIGLSFAVICHVFKDVLDLFSSRVAKIGVAAAIIGFVIGLLYSFARLRLSMISDIGEVSTEHLSETNFVLLNLVLLLSGMALTLYKPSKKVVSDYRKQRKITKQIKELKGDYNKADKRLASLTKERNTKLDQLKGIILMAHHYERVVASEYERVFALWCSEAIITRRDDQMPKCFSEKPVPLKTYFDKIDIQTL